MSEIISERQTANLQYNSWCENSKAYSKSFLGDKLEGKHDNSKSFVLSVKTNVSFWSGSLSRSCYWYIDLRKVTLHWKNSLSPTFAKKQCKRSLWKIRDIMCGMGLRGHLNKQYVNTYDLNSYSYVSTCLYCKQFYWIIYSHEKVWIHNYIPNSSPIHWDITLRSQKNFKQFKSYYGWPGGTKFFKWRIW